MRDLVIGILLSPFVICAATFTVCVAVGLVKGIAQAFKK